MDNGNDNNLPQNEGEDINISGQGFEPITDNNGDGLQNARGDNLEQPGEAGFEFDGGSTEIEGPLSEENGIPNGENEYGGGLEIELPTGNNGDEKKNSGIIKILIGVAILAVIGIGAFTLLRPTPQKQAQAAVLKTLSAIQKTYSGDPAISAILDGSYKTTLSFNGQQVSPEAMGMDFDNLTFYNDSVNKIMAFVFNKGGSNVASLYTDNQDAALLVREQAYYISPATFGADFNAYFENFKTEFESLGFNENTIPQDFSLRYDDLAPFIKPQEQNKRVGEYTQVYVDLSKKATYGKESVKHTLNGAEVNADKITAKITGPDLTAAMAQIQEINQKYNVGTENGTEANVTDLPAVTLGFVVYQGTLLEASAISDDSPDDVYTISVDESGGLIKGLSFTAANSTVDTTVGFTNESVGQLYKYVVSLSSAGTTLVSMDVVYDSTITENNFSINVPDLSALVGMPIPVSLNGNITKTDGSYELYIGTLDMSVQAIELDMSIKIEKMAEAVAVPEATEKFDTIGPEELFFDKFFIY
ncbi:MAG: hypothetical protein LBV08_09800 [Clostridiales bacterium]|nr:hypothetical protein [Clostridiales bacterium]